MPAKYAHKGRSPPPGEIGLVTAIGFELVRRNVRMIIDRSPEDEPLIPSEETKIRMELSRLKARLEKNDDQVDANRYIGDTELTYMKSANLGNADQDGCV